MILHNDREVASKIREWMAEEDYDGVRCLIYIDDTKKYTRHIYYVGYSWYIMVKDTPRGRDKIDRAVVKKRPTDPLGIELFKKYNIAYR